MSSNIIVAVAVVVVVAEQSYTHFIRDINDVPMDYSQVLN